MADDNEEAPPEIAPETYKGLDVLATVIKITNTGDGLSKAMSIEPVMVEFGDVVYVALRLEKTKDGYDVLFSKDDETPLGVAYVQQFKATQSAFIPERAVRKAIDSMHDKIVAAEEARKSGQGSLVLSYDDEDDDINHDDPSLGHSAAKEPRRRKDLE